MCTESPVMPSASNLDVIVYLPLTSGSIQPSATSFALEVLRFLMIDEHFLVIEVAFTIVAPWPAENLINIGVAALLLAHAVGNAVELGVGKEVGVGEG
jgi:hypothetical protein